jgi:hypothetical protein
MQKIRLALDGCSSCALRKKTTTWPLLRQEHKSTNIYTYAADNKADIFACLDQKRFDKAQTMEGHGCKKIQLMKTPHTPKVLVNLFGKKPK